MSHRTLVVHTGGIGDFICALPALQWLAQSTRIEIAGIPERAALAQMAGIASAVHNLDATDFHTVFSSPSNRLRSFCGAFDAAVVWMNDADGAMARGLQMAGIADVRCFEGVPPQRWTGHAASWYATCLGATISLPFELNKNAATREYGVILHPGSGDAKKNWPLDSFTRVASTLSERGYAIQWCRGPAEIESGAALPGTALPPMPLAALPGIFSGARLFIGNDSGIGHLAAVAGCPTLSIFGPTDPAIWRPIGPKVWVLRGELWPADAAVESAALEWLGPPGNLWPHQGATRTP